MATTIGQRVYLVRQARGDGGKNPERLDDFAAELTRRARRRYDGSMISRMENGGRAVSIREAELIAAMDPRKRSPSWVAFGERATELEDITAGAVMLTPAQLARAAEAAARTEADRRAARSGPRAPQRKRGGKG